MCISRSGEEGMWTLTVSFTSPSALKGCINGRWGDRSVAFSCACAALQKRLIDWGGRLHVFPSMDGQTGE